VIDTLQSLLSFIVAIGILVTIHELGHFLVARRVGIQVLRFSVGFGKPLLRHVDRKGTEFVVAAIPLGGYVRMLGEHDDEVTSENRHLAFSQKSIVEKTAVVIAGPLFNFIFAIAAYWIMYMAGIPGQTAVIGEIKPQSAAWAAGMKADEKIIRVNDVDTPTWGVVNTALLDAALDDDTIKVDTSNRAGTMQNRYHVRIDERSQLLDEKGVIHNLGIIAWRPPVWIGDVTPGGPAEQAGLIKGDRVISADGREIKNWGEWVSYIRDRPAMIISVVISRDGQTVMLRVKPERIREDDGQTIGRIGVQRYIPEHIRQQHLSEIKYGPAAALGHAIIKTYDLSGLMLRMLGRMIVGEASHKNISGPITIAQYAGVSASLGWMEFVRFLALISISLGVLNLLPVPMLDGGHLLYYVIESVRGGPLSEQAQAFGQQVGIVLLLLLMGLAFYNDLSRLFG